MMIEWDIFTDDDNQPHLVVNTRPGTTGLDRALRPATLAECERAIKLLNEEGNDIVRLMCKTEGCASKGGWIQRRRDDKAMYPCDVCGRAMER